MKDYSQLTKILLEIQRNYDIDANRMGRAAHIVSDLGVRQTSATRYAVRSQSRRAEYLVDIDTLNCGCKDAKQNHICKHFLACEIYRALPEIEQTFDEWLAGAIGKIEIPESRLFSKSV